MFAACYKPNEMPYDDAYITPVATSDAMQNDDAFAAPVASYDESSVTPSAAPPNDDAYIAPVASYDESSVTPSAASPNDDAYIAPNDDSFTNPVTPSDASPADDDGPNKPSRDIYGGAGAFTFNAPGKATSLPSPTAGKLPEWHGFNLLNLFNTLNCKPFDENIFEMISSFGFDFVRLPIDYRCMMKNAGWDEFSVAALKQIDRAIEFGVRYDVHICLNLHRAPGYTVASPPEPTDLWSDAAPQGAFARIWGALAERYKDVPNEYLSFNLVNEPPDINERTYAKVMGMAADAIWACDPQRLIIADGLNYGLKPSKMIAALGIAQATRGYQPFNLTHYKADWVAGADQYPAPKWPDCMIPMYLYGFGKRDIRSVYDINFSFTQAYTLEISIGIVSDRARLIARADGEQIYDHLFISDAGGGECEKTVYAAEWGIYQNVFNKAYEIEIPAGTERLTLEVTDGDWLSVNDMKFAPQSAALQSSKTQPNARPSFSITPNNAGWGEKIPPIFLTPDGKIDGGSVSMQNRQWLRDTYLQPWEELAQSGCGVMVGEWGAFNRTPHDVVLTWMEDSLINYCDAGFGWALWNFDDAFGVLDSGRADVEYENYNGHRLDRKMLNLLQAYVKH